MNSSYETALNTIEKAIAMAGTDPFLCRSWGEESEGKLGEPGQWNLVRGETELWIDLIYVEQEERTYFQVMSPFGKLPIEADGIAYKSLLEANYRMIDAHFVSYKQGTYIRILHDIDGLTEESAFLSINRVAHFSEMFHKEYYTKFGFTILDHLE